MNIWLASAVDLPGLRRFAITLARILLAIESRHTPRKLLASLMFPFLCNGTIWPFFRDSSPRSALVVNILITRWMTLSLHFQYALRMYTMRTPSLPGADSLTSSSASMISFSDGRVFSFWLAVMNLTSLLLSGICLTVFIKVPESFSYPSFDTLLKWALNSSVEIVGPVWCFCDLVPSSLKVLYMSPFSAAFSHSMMISSHHSLSSCRSVSLSSCVRLPIFLLMPLGHRQACHVILREFG